MNSFKLEMRAMKNRMNSKIAESRFRSSSPAPQQPSPPSSNQATQSATQPITASPPTPQAPPQLDSSTTVTQQQSSLAKKKRNERTRQQYKRKKTLHVTMQLSVKEVEHTNIVSERIKLVLWDWSTTSLWCWHAIIPWDEIIMVLVLWCGVSEMPRIGIGWSQQRSDGPYLNELEPSEVLVPQLFGCIYSILNPLAGNTSNPGEPVGFTPAVGLTLPFFSACMCVFDDQLAS